MSEKITLKEAREQNKIDQFIKEHDGEVGDMDKFDAAISSMARGSSAKGKSPKAPATSLPDGSGN